MERGDSIVEQYAKKEKIEEIIKIIKSKSIKKVEHFEIRILQRDVPEELVDEIFPLFDKVKLIDKRIHKKGDIGYDLYYELSNSRTLKLCFIITENRTLLINAMLRHRKWQGSIRFSNKR